MSSTFESHKTKHIVNTNANTRREDEEKKTINFESKGSEREKKAMVKSESGRGRDQTQNKLSEYNKFWQKRRNKLYFLFLFFLASLLLSHIQCETTLILLFDLKAKPKMVQKKQNLRVSSAFHLHTSRVNTATRSK